MVEKIKSWVFPGPKNASSVKVSYPFVFSSYEDFGDPGTFFFGGSISHGDSMGKLEPSESLRLNGFRMSGYFHDTGYGGGMDAAFGKSRFDKSSNFDVDYDRQVEVGFINFYLMKCMDWQGLQVCPNLGIGGLQHSQERLPCDPSIYDAFCYDTYNVEGLTAGVDVQWAHYLKGDSFGVAPGFQWRTFLSDRVRHMQLGVSLSVFRSQK